MSGSYTGGADPLKELEKLVEDFRVSGLRELHARAGELEVYLSQDPDAPGLDGPRVAVGALAQVSQVSAAPAVASGAPASLAQAAPAGTESDVPADAHVVVAPYMGTFYRAPKPGAPVYVEVGSEVGAEAELCLVEVMKLFTAVRAGIAGTVVAILAGDGDLVQAGQPLFAIKAG